MGLARDFLRFGALDGRIGDGAIHDRRSVRSSRRGRPSCAIPVHCGESEVTIHVAVNHRRATYGHAVEVDDGGGIILQDIAAIAGNHLRSAGRGEGQGLKRMNVSGKHQLNPSGQFVLRRGLQ